jgi:hypothetical protein
MNPPALPRPHPLFGGITLRRTDWESAIARHTAGWTVEEALTALPTGRFYELQFARIVADWPTRQTYLQQRGAPGQLDREQALYDHLTAN